MESWAVEVGEDWLGENTEAPAVVTFSLTHDSACLQFTFYEASGVTPEQWEALAGPASCEVETAYEEDEHSAGARFDSDTGEVIFSLFLCSGGSCVVAVPRELCESALRGLAASIRGNSGRALALAAGQPR